MKCLLLLLMSLPIISAGLFQDISGYGTAEHVIMIGYIRLSLCWCIFLYDVIQILYFEIELTDKKEFIQIDAETTDLP